MKDGSNINDLVKPFDASDHDCKTCPSYKNCKRIAIYDNDTVVMCIFYHTLLEELNKLNVLFIERMLSL